MSTPTTTPSIEKKLDLILSNQDNLLQILQNQQKIAGHQLTILTNQSKIEGHLQTLLTGLQDAHANQTQIITNQRTLLEIRDLVKHQQAIVQEAALKGIKAM